MSRHASEEKMCSLYEVIRSYPGERPGALAEEVGLSRSEVMRLLPSMNDSGYLLFEDERGGLWPFPKGGGKS